MSRVCVHTQKHPNSTGWLLLWHRVGNPAVFYRLPSALGSFILSDINVTGF